MKVALYARVSTEKQEKQETIQSQLEALREFARKKEYAIVGEYIDDGYSGELLARPELDRLRDDAQKKAFEAVLFYSPDRLARDLTYQGVVLKEFKALEIRPIFYSLPSVDDSPFGRLQINMLGAFAEFEKALILERTRRGRLHKANRGVIVGGQALYGYSYVPGDQTKSTDGHYELNPVEARVVKMIFKLFIEHHLSVRGIAKELTKKGIAPRRGKEWRTSSLHRVLRNETYATAVTFYNKLQNVEPPKKEVNGQQKHRRFLRTARRVRPRNEWVAIQLPESLRLISPETFAKAQRLLALNGQVYPRTPKFQYLLRGLVVCSSCGAPFQGLPYHDVPYYRCGNRHRTFPRPRKCDIGAISGSKLESNVWEAIVQALREPDLITAQLKELAKEAQRAVPKHHHDLTTLESALRKLTEKRDRLLDAYQAGAITLEQLKGQMAKIDQHENGLKEELGVLEQAKTVAQPAYLGRSFEQNCRQIGRRLEELDGDFEGRRRLLIDLVERIVLDLKGKVVRISGAIPAQTQDTRRTASQSLGHDARLPPRPRARVWRGPAPGRRRSQAHTDSQPWSRVVHHAAAVGSRIVRRGVQPPAASVLSRSRARHPLRPPQRHWPQARGMCGAVRFSRPSRSGGCRESAGGFRQAPALPPRRLRRASQGPADRTPPRPPRRWRDQRARLPFSGQPAPD